MGCHHRLYNQLHYKYLLCLLTIGSPVFAEGDVHNNATPVAAATGNVTNSAVQFQNNGAPSRQQFSNGNSCNGSTLTFSPFYMGNDVQPETEDGYVINENWGIQLAFMVPLNRDLTKQCERIAALHERNMKLSQEMTRALKCADLHRKGFTFRPDTDSYKLCSDVVPIQLVKKDNVSNP